MKVYITYDRYERNEWFRVDNVDTSLTRSLKKFKEKDLPEFLEYGPDDCHSYILQKVDMTKKEYEQLLQWMDDPTQSLENFGSESSDFFKFMYSIYDRTGCVGSEDEVIRSTDGCSDNYEVIHFYGRLSRQDTSDDNIYEEIMEKLSDDDKLREYIIKLYVKYNY